jgi:hypothetical protein
MSEVLRGIAARYASALSAAQSIVPMGDEQRLHALRCIERYGLVWNHLRCVVLYGHKTREEMTDEEWKAFIALSVDFFNNNLRDFGSEESAIAYIRYWMSWLFLWADALDESEIPQIVEWFLALPDRADYGYKE